MPTWTRSLTWPEDAQDDWLVLRDGQVVGRTYWDGSQHCSKQWRWSVMTLPADRGYAQTLEEAIREIRRRASDKWGDEPCG